MKKNNPKKLTLFKETIVSLSDAGVSGGLLSGGPCASLFYSCFYECDGIVPSIEVGCKV